jgi:hypothetical protein
MIGNRTHAKCTPEQARRLDVMLTAYNQLTEAHDTLTAIFDGHALIRSEAGNICDLFWACEDLAKIIERVDRVGLRLAGVPCQEDPRGRVVGYDPEMLIAAADGVVGQEWLTDPAGFLSLFLAQAFEITEDAQ